MCRSVWLIGGGCLGGDSFRLKGLLVSEIAWLIERLLLLYKTSYETLLADR